MLTTLLAGITLCTFAIIAFRIAGSSYQRWFAIPMGIIGFVAVLIGVVALIVTAVVSFDWVASEHKAQILNREYGTHYTREDVFYASDVIDMIREIDRTRIDARLKTDNSQK